VTAASARLWSAAALVPVVLVLVLAVPAKAAAGILLLPVLAAVGEWARLSGFGRPGTACAAIVLALLLAVGLAGLGLRGGSFLGGALGLLVDALFAVFLFGPGLRGGPAWLELTLGILALAVLWWTAFVFFSGGSAGREALLSLLVLVWTADTAAYLVGRRWGRRSLAPRLSPGKTWEGALGGLAATLVAALLLRAGGALGRAGLVFVLALGAAVWAAALLGDLSESRLKRRRGVKDSGTLIPGHGGLLDRIDGLVASAPVFYCFWCLQGFAKW
jgi:phosphatidate cytidylyltransferase